VVSGISVKPDVRNSNVTLDRIQSDITNVKNMNLIHLGFSQSLFVALRGTREKISVSDPGCLSRMPDPDFYLFRIPHPKTATKDRGEKTLLSNLFFVATNFTKLKIILFFQC
jgi:hypothetical protein